MNINPRQLKAFLFLVVFIFFCLGLTKIDLKRLFILSVNTEKTTPRQFIIPSNNYNLILISIDTLRADHMGIYGYSNNTTPFIDSWAKNALVFTKAFTPFPATLPSFTSLMTGRHPFQTSIISNYDGNLLSPNIKTLAEILKQNDYLTTAFVSNYAVSKESSELERGFDMYQYVHNMHNSDELDYGGIPEEATNWIRNNKDNKFFIWTHFSAPHDPYSPRKDLRCKFKQELCSKVESKTNIEWDEERKQLEQMVWLSETPPEGLGVFESLYDGEISADDEGVGKILTTISELGLDKKSVIVIYGDHGESFDHNHYSGHGGVTYNSNTRVPLIISYPEGYARKSDRLILNTDFLPTILKLLGIDHKDDNLDGIGFADEFGFVVVDQKDKRQELYMLANYNESTKSSDNFALYNGKYKYIYSFLENKIELYNLDSDPNEAINLVNEETKIGKEMGERLIDKLSEFNLPRKGSLTIDESSDSIEKLKSLGY